MSLYLSEQAATCGKYIPLRYPYRLLNATTKEPGLPYEAGSLVQYRIPSTVPHDATAIQLYAFITVKNYPIGGEEKRGYYTFSTSAGYGATYSQYMNVVFTVDDVVANSANIRLPLFKDRTLYVKLSDLYPVQAQSTQDNFKITSDVYLIGFCY